MASRSVNKVFLVGHLGRDAETKFTPSGTSVTRFSVATTRRWKDQQTNDWKEETNWTNVSLWRNDKLGQYLTKGKQVHVEGRLQTRSYDDKDTGKKVYTTEVVADDVILLGGANGESDSGTPTRNSISYSKPASSPGKQSASAQGSFPPAADDPYDGMGITDDDIPF